MAMPIRADMLETLERIKNDLLNMHSKRILSAEVIELEQQVYRLTMIVEQLVKEIIRS
jgi:hypothetical protein